MWHLPKDKARVKVFPMPGRRAAQNVPGEGQAVNLIPPHGMVVEWNEFRLSQYKLGELSLHDPRPSDCPTRKNDPSKEEQHPDGKECLHDSAAHMPPELKKALEAGADKPAAADDKSKKKTPSPTGSAGGSDQ